MAGFHHPTIHEANSVHSVITFSPVEGPKCLYTTPLTWVYIHTLRCGKKRTQNQKGSYFHNRQEWRKKASFFSLLSAHNVLKGRRWRKKLRHGKPHKWANLEVVKWTWDVWDHYRIGCKRVITKFLNWRLDFHDKENYKIISQQGVAKYRKRAKWPPS